MPQSTKSIAQELIKNIELGETKSISFWSGVEEVVKRTGQIAAAVFMSRLNTLASHTKNKKLIHSTKQDFIIYLETL